MTHTNTLNQVEKGVSKTSQHLMGTGLIIGLVLIGMFSFTALIALSGYADDLRNKDNGQAHALSSSAIGFAGLKILLENLDVEIRTDSEKPLYGEIDTLRIYTLDSAYQTDGLDTLDPNDPKLIVLPKWSVMPMPKVQGWVQKLPFRDLQAARPLASNLETLTGELTINRIGKTGGDLTQEHVFSFVNYDTSYQGYHSRLQTFNSETLIPIVTVEKDDILLAKVPDSQTYILSDPDFLNTAGLDKRSKARFSVSMLNYIMSETETSSIRLDLSLHGISSKRNMIKLFTQPPFLSVTIIIIALIALLGWQAFIRFGDPKKGSDIDFGADRSIGPQSLATTTAEFLAIARREPLLMPDYAALIRKQAQYALQGQSRLSVSSDSLLDSRERGRNITPTFETLKTEANAVTQRHEMTRVATALQKWKKEITE